MELRVLQALAWLVVATAAIGWTEVSIAIWLLFSLFLTIIAVVFGFDDIAHENHVDRLNIIIVGVLAIAMWPVVVIWYTIRRAVKL